MALSARQRRRRAAPGGPRRGRLRHAGGRARAAPARVPRGAPGLGRRGAHLAGGGRQRGRGLDGHAVRRPTRRRPGPRSRPRSSPPRGAAMNTLQDVVAALERAQLLVEMPDLHTRPEITGLTADSRKVERGMLYCAVHGSARSEEHTSELQSHSDLVCRLLLEKKKENKKI